MRRAILKQSELNFNDARVFCWNSLLRAAVVCLSIGLLTTPAWCQYANSYLQNATAEALGANASWIQPTGSVVDAPVTTSLGESSSINANACSLIARCDSANARPSTLLVGLDLKSKETRAKGSRWFRSEYDFDSRGFNVLHFMGNSPLPYGFDIWGFIDIEGADLAGANREDLSRYFLEIDIKKKLWKNGGIIGEYNDLQGSGNAIGRLGFFHKPNLEFLSPDCGRFAGKGFVAFKVFPYESDGRGGQASLAWNKSFDNVLDGRLSAGGFVDVNFNAGSTRGRTVVVTEHQVRMRLFEGIHLITEFRLNEFLQDDFGIAPGIQYRF